MFCNLPCKTIEDQALSIKGFVSQSNLAHGFSIHRDMLYFKAFLWILHPEACTIASPPLYILYIAKDIIPKLLLKDSGKHELF